MKYTLLLFIFYGHSQKMNKKVSYAHQYLSRTESIFSGISLFLLSLDYVCPEISNHSKNKCNAEVLHKHIQYKNLHHSLLPNTSTNEASNQLVACAF